jgi:hypothetical protein
MGPNDNNVVWALGKFYFLYLYVTNQILMFLG